jgi:hypothetical protein
VLSKDDADRSLGALSAARDRIAAQMYAIDTHPAFARLGADVAVGRTEQVRSALGPEVAWLWANFGVLRDALERATALRSTNRPGDRGWAELTTVLTGPAVGLDADGLPTELSADSAERSASSGIAGTAASTVTLAAVVQATEQHAATTLTQLSEVDASWGAVTTEFGRASAAVQEVATLAAGLGAPEVAEPLRAQATEIERLDLADPLGAAPGGRLSPKTQARCTALLDAARLAGGRLTDLIRAREGYPQRRSELAALIDAVAAEETAVADAQLRAQEKIADPGLAPPPHAATVLRGRLDELDRLQAAAQWPRLAELLSTVESSAIRARDRAVELRGVANGLLARRDELRGRLEAYRAKAVALGYAEDAGLASAFDQAHELLFTAPCDLRSATRAVHAYQTALAARPARTPDSVQRSPATSLDVGFGSPVDDRRL